MFFKSAGISIFLILSLSAFAATAWAAERYKPVVNTMDHMGPGAFNFLEGNWKSVYPKENFCESWIKSEDGLLTCVRKIGGPNAEYDIIVFTGNRVGADVSMRHLTHSLIDTTEHIQGRWDAPTTNRGVLSFKRHAPTIEITASYDSPSDDCLTVTIEETAAHVPPKKRTILLTRVEPSR